MSANSSSFRAKTTVKAADLDHRRKINFNISRYNAVVPVGKDQFSDLELARKRAKNIKWKALETLDEQLQIFESQLHQRGVKVIWAQTADEALAEILKICQEKQCKTIVKSKSMVTEEIHLNKFLEKNGRSEVRANCFKILIQNFPFFFFQGCAGIAVFATTAFTLAEIANKLCLHHFVTHQDVIDQDHK